MPSPRAHRFAVGLPGGGGDPGDLLRGEGLEQVERAADDVVVVTLPGAAGSAKEAWRHLLGRAAGAAWAAPLLVDDEGGEQVPTGEVTVRFVSPPPDPDLAAFAGRHGLVLRRRNEFVAQQAVFAPAAPRATYLPELCEELAADPAVAHAWANTVSRYRRA